MRKLNFTIILLNSSKQEEILNELNKTTSKAAPEKFSTWDNILQLLGLCILLIIILIAAYYTSRFVGRYKLGQLKNSNFEIIETYKISTSKMLQLVRIADKYVVLGVSKDNITYIMELDNENILTHKDEEGENLSFRQIFDKLKSKKE